MRLNILGLATCVVSAAALGAQATSATSKPQMAQGAPAGATARQQESPITFTVDMKSDMQVPPVAGNASGHATLWLSKNKLRYEIDVKDLSGPATMAHIHVGKLGNSGPPVYTFAIKKLASGKIAEGTIDLTAMPVPGISSDSLKVLLNNGAAYINVHTAAHRGGEIRGQIAKE